MTAAVPGLRTSVRRVDGPLEDLVADREPSVWLRHGEGFVGRGAALRMDLGTGRERFRRAGEAVAALGAEAAGGGDTPPVAFVSLTFDERSHGSVLVVPEVVVARRGGEAWISWAGAGEPDLEAVPEKDPAPDRVRFAGSSIPDLLWLDAVATAVGRIRAGELDKVVLARDHAVWSETPFSPRRLVRRLAEHFPGCFTFLVDGFVGASPELLVRRTGRSLQSQVLAGTAPRGEDAAADERLGEDLLGSDKDREEHRLAASSVRDVLGELCDGLEMDPEPRLVKLENVQHLATRFEGRLRAPAGRVVPTVLEVTVALHPTPAVGGVPRDAAVEAIRELERMDRGRYAGPVGWTDAAGDGEFAVALRCAELSGARARLFAGSGIVAASLPEAELEETRLKLRAMQVALEP